MSRLSHEISSILICPETMEIYGAKQLSAIVIGAY